MKVCTHCEIEKEDIDFYSHPTGKDKLNSKCKQCIKSDTKNYYQRNKEKVKNNTKEWRSQNKERSKENTKKWRSNNKLYTKIKRKEWNLLNKEKILTKQKEKRKVINYYEKYGKKRYQEIKSGKKGSIRKLRMEIFNSINTAFRRQGYTKKSKTYTILGCSYEFLMKYIGEKPSSNHQLDHICPCAQAQNEEELIKLNHYSNLRWLHATSNLSKSDSWTPEGEELCFRLLNRNWIHRV